MSKNLQKVLLALAAVSSTAFATEIRTPWLTEQGPIRYTFEKLHEDKYNLNFWSAMHMKEAHKAFLKNGTKSQPLSALIFNQADFTIGQAFPTFANAVTPLPAAANASNFQGFYQNYNPYAPLTTLSPRVAYTEYGCDFGARWDMPVWGNKGRIGLRATVPFRRIEMERLDSGLSESEAPTTNFVDSKVITINRDDAGAPDLANAADILVKAYRMDLISSLINPNGTPILAGVVNGVTILGSQIGGATGNVAPAALAAQLPNGKPVVDAFQFDAVATSVAASQFIIGNFAIQNPDYATNLPTQPVADVATLDFFDTADDYSATFASPGFAANASKTWLVFHRQTNSPDPEKFGAGVANAAGAGGTVARGIDAVLAQYTQNVFSFLDDQNFSLDSVVRSGIGDIDLDLFFEYAFNADWMGELMLGVRFPTGGSNNEYGNPYNTVQLGNGNHWEVKLGALIAFQPWHFMNFKVDAKYSFVIESDEHRIAAFKGATIKNFGPRADADVNWGYFVGHFDMNFFHPKTSDIRGTLGYEFYYKTEDDVKYKQAAVNSFLGNVIGGTAGLFALDNNLAKQNTESMSHKIRCETSFQVHKYFELFAGSSATFAGQNVMKDYDAHGGFNVRF